MKRRQPGTTMGVVPIGVPLIVGPAVLTTVLILGETRGIVPTLAALVVNLLVVWAVFVYSKVVMSRMGEGGSKAVAKIFAMLLTAFAVMMIRKGIFGLMSGGM